ncbi:MAG TPA: hypothetical protein VK897_15035 [Anaerolineales bacterium]|nr:hypothetical protein [Anaerolineales bacterium]
MKCIVSIVVLAMVLVVWGGLACSPREATPAVFTDPEEWSPPVFPGAVRDEQIQVNMTAVAATPEGLDETACICFGFPVHNAVFHAYRSDGDTQEIMDFYAEEMAAQGWKEVANDTSEATLPHRIWQHGTNGPMVAYLMVAPMEDGRTLIYLSAAESDTPQEVIEE